MTQAWPSMRGIESRDGAAGVYVRPEDRRSLLHTGDGVDGVCDSGI